MAYDFKTICRLRGASAVAAELKRPDGSPYTERYVHMLLAGTKRMSVPVIRACMAAFGDEFDHERHVRELLHPLSEEATA